MLCPPAHLVTQTRYDHQFKDISDNQTCCISYFQLDLSWSCFQLDLRMIKVVPKRQSGTRAKCYRNESIEWFTREQNKIHVPEEKPRGYHRQLSKKA